MNGARGLFQKLAELYSKCEECMDLIQSWGYDENKIKVPGRYQDEFLRIRRLVTEVLDNLPRFFRRTSKTAYTIEQIEQQVVPLFLLFIGFGLWFIKVASALVNASIEWVINVPPATIGVSAPEPSILTD